MLKIDNTPIARPETDTISVHSPTGRGTIEAIFREEIAWSPWFKYFPLAFWREFLRLRNVTTTRRLHERRAALADDLRRLFEAKLPPAVIAAATARTPESRPRFGALSGYLTGRTPSGAAARLIAHASALAELMRLAPDWEFFDEAVALAYPEGDVWPEPTPFLPGGEHPTDEADGEATEG